MTVFVFIFIGGWVLRWSRWGGVLSSAVWMKRSYVVIGNVTVLTGNIIRWCVLTHDTFYTIYCSWSDYLSYTCWMCSCCSSCCWCCVGFGWDGNIWDGYVELCERLEIKLSMFDDTLVMLDQVRCYHGRIVAHGHVRPFGNAHKKSRTGHHPNDLTHSIKKLIRLGIH